MSGFESIAVPQDISIPKLPGFLLKRSLRLIEKHLNLLNVRFALEAEGVIKPKQ